MFAEKLLDLTAPATHDESKLRYTVGEDYIFFIFHAAYGHHGADGKYFWRTFHNPAADPLKEIRSLKLRCESHHKVAWAYEPENKKYDGFIFVDEMTGERYYNQYPRASYGQMDTDADYYIRNAKVDSDDPGEHEAFKALSFDAQDFFMANWKLGTQVLHNLAGSIQQLKTTRNDANANISDPAVDSLIKFKGLLEDHLRQTYGLAVNYERIRMKRTDGSEVLTDIVDAALVPGKYWIRWAGAGQFRDEGNWYDLSELPASPPLTIVDWETIRATQYLPTAFQAEKPTDKQVN